MPPQKITLRKHKVKFYKQLDIHRWIVIYILISLLICPSDREINPFGFPNF
ncbi:hypothetical protein PN499_18770 [Kamptonema animale CS-326]|nr:hypothetical protein [Kamptonema animale CS-326]